MLARETPLKVHSNLNVPLKISYIIAIILNSITCPFTVALNVLVIMAVKRRPRLQSYTNILLACLAVTDALTGLLVQPTFIIWTIFQLLGGINTDIVRSLHFLFLTVVTFSSALHLMLVTCERLIAIKYTMAYPHLVTTQGIKDDFQSELRSLRTLMFIGRTRWNANQCYSLEPHTLSLRPFKVLFQQIH